MQQIPTAVLSSRPFQFFWLGADQWRSAMVSIGTKALARLEVINYHQQGHKCTYDAGRVLVQLNHDTKIELSPDLKRKEDFDALLAANMHLSLKYPNGIPMHSFGDRPTLYRRSGWRLWLPITCNCYYAPDWDAISSQAEAFNLGAISA